MKPLSADFPQRWLWYRKVHWSIYLVLDNLYTKSPNVQEDGFQEYVFAGGADLFLEELEEESRDSIGTAMVPV